MRKNKVKSNLRAGIPSFGVGILWPSPELVEFCGFLGFDWLWIDLEHGQFDLQVLTNTIRAAELSAMIPVGRIQSTRDPSVVLKYLEAGLMGIIMPHVQKKEDIEFLVNSVKYPPEGIRSSGRMRVANWGITQSYEEHIETTNNGALIMALVEDKKGLANIDEILETDGLDAVVIGYGDLSMKMGYPGQKYHPEVLKLGHSAANKVLAHPKVALQVTAQKGDEAREWIKKGALMVRCGAPWIFEAAAKDWLVKAKE
jgi:4-hydroxy-2-oxoheptanedioate aldolase